MGSRPTLEELFGEIDRLVATTGKFIEPWGTPTAPLLEELESFFGTPLPPDFREFALRYDNLRLGHMPIKALGPEGGIPAAKALTLERRDEWPALPSDSLALGEEGTDMVVMRRDGVIELRTESTRDFAVFESFSSFTAFLEQRLRATVDHAKLVDRLPPSYAPFIGG
jgi:hypothetical protein